MNFIGKLFFIFSLILLIAILFITSVYFPLEENSTTQKVVNIPSGTNAKEIVYILEKNEIIRKNNYTFRILIKLMKLEDQLKYGEYYLSPEFIYFPYEELAKYYEHYLKDYQKAETVLKEALNIEENIFLREKLQYRLNRIKGKL